MKEEGIKAVWIKKFKLLRNKVPVRGLKNIVNGEFKPERKNKIWVTDITYIWTTKGFVYLSSIMELYSRKIISWEVSDKLGVELVIKTIRRAKSIRKIDRPLIIHSDQGSQYTSKAYRE